MEIEKDGTISIVGYARTNGEIGRILETLLNVGILGKVSFLEQTPPTVQNKLVKIEIPGEELTQAKATELLSFMRRAFDVRC
jgi:hypothetical protein